MRFFIDRVTTYATSGKTRKGVAIQAAVADLEYCLLVDEQALSELTHCLHKLVDTVNAKFKGAPLSLHFVTGQLSIRPPQTGTEQPVAVISYKPVAGNLFGDGGIESVRTNIVAALYDNHLDLASEFLDAMEEGGAL